jgi:hypothetical protein
MTCERCLTDAAVGEHGWLKCPLEPRPSRTSVIDDQIEGGPRFFDTMGHEPVWIESKSQWRAEVAARQLVNVDKHDRAYYQRKFREHDEKLRDTGRAD